ncbi:MAG: phosphatase PAP2 family protein, partial [Spirochaetaceae bacterium]|nr:phosphatase PAP2 family protein [Spirochaetaceae bacterium]
SYWYSLLPMAPPRMLPGYVDTLADTSDQGWWGSNASAPRGLGGLTNELPAMPSLHVGWALWCTWVVFLCCRRRSVRILAVAYTAGTTVVVVAYGRPLRPRRHRRMRRDRPRLQRRTSSSSTTRSSISSTASSR